MLNLCRAFLVDTRSKITVDEAIRCDLDAMIKSLIDYCVRIELVTDDSPKYLRRLIVEWGTVPAGCRVEIRGME